MITYDKVTVETLELEMPIPERITLEFLEQFHASPEQVYTIGEGKYRIESIDIFNEISDNPLLQYRSRVHFARVY